MEIKTTEEIASDFNSEEKWNDEQDYKKWVAVDNLNKLLNKELTYRESQKNLFSKGYFHAFEKIKKELQKSSPCLKQEFDKEEKMEIPHYQRRKIEINEKEYAIFKQNKKIIFRGENLKEIDLNSNKITKIDNLNENLREIDLDNNQITKIENLNENLEYIYLNNNQIKTISRASLELIKRKGIKVFGVNIKKLKVEE